MTEPGPDLTLDFDDLRKGLPAITPSFGAALAESVQGRAVDNSASAYIAVIEFSRPLALVVKR